MTAQTVYTSAIWGLFSDPPSQTNKSNWGVEEMNWGGLNPQSPPGNSHTDHGERDPPSGVAGQLRSKGLAQSFLSVFIQKRGRKLRI